MDDKRGGIAAQEFDIDIAEAINTNPVISSSPVLNVKAGEEYKYNVIATDGDNDSLAYSLDKAPKGMTIDSKSGVVLWTPAINQAGKSDVSVKVSDGHGGEAIQSFTVDVEVINSLPKITSTAVTAAKEGAAYTYNVIATDADKDILTYELTVSPSGMTIDEKTGVINWTPTHEQAGKNNVTVKVSDGRGGEATQSFAIDVETVVVNTPPQITSQAVTTATAGQKYTYSVKATDADNDILTYALADKPDGMTIDAASGVIGWTPSQSQNGSFDVKVQVSDGKGGSDTQIFFVSVGDNSSSVQDDAIRPFVSIATGSPNEHAGVGDTVPIMVIATDNVNVVSKSLKINGKPVQMDSQGKAAYKSTEAGVIKIEASAKDAAGNEGNASTELVFITPGNGDAVPTAQIASPADCSKISIPTDIVGTANDDVKLISYKLQYSLNGKNEFIEIASGTSPVVNGVLGKIDPTMMRNGIYDIRLMVEDSSGHISQCISTYEMDGEMKVGNFNVSFEDLTIPVAGMPITVMRTYDSRNKANGDFGVGWSLGIKNILVSETNTPGQYWEENVGTGLFGITKYSFEETKKHEIEFAFPDGHSEKFKVVVPDVNITDEYVTVTFQPLEGTFSKLEDLDAKSTTCKWYGDWFGDMGQKVYDPQNFKLTEEDGTVYIINRSGTVESITDKNGNTIKFASDGITHSLGKSVSFTRDSKGRITQITDPMGNSLKYGYDQYGDLISFTDQSGNITRFRYNSTHGLLDIIDPRGIRGVRNEYDDNGRLIANIDADGNRTEYTHDIGARQEAVKDKLGNISVFAYDDNGNILQKADPMGHTTKYTYDANNNKLTETNELGETTSFAYDNKKRLLSTTDPAGNKTEYSYNDSGKVTSIKDPMGNTTVNTYDSKGNITSITDIQGNVTTFTYDPAGNKTGMSDLLGLKISYTYDAYGNKLSETDANGSVTQYTYDSNGNQTSKSLKIKTSLGTQTVTTSKVYDSNRRVIKETDPYGNTEETQYNKIGKVAVSIDKRRNRKEYTYDNEGNQTQILYQDGTTEKFTYDLEGRKLTSTDREGRTISYTYNKNGKLTKTTYPDGTFTQIEYDAAGRISKKVDELGNAKIYGYDTAGCNTSVTDALGNVTLYEYDKNGNVTKMSDAKGNITTYEYTGKHRTKTTFADSTFTLASYDVAGNKLSETDQAGNTTKYEYDAFGRLTKVTDALNNETSYSYDESGNKISQTDANGHTTKFEYDMLGNMTKHILPLGMSETFTYDEVGNVKSKQDFNGDVTSFEYDSDGWLTKKIFKDGTSETYTYTKTGKRDSVTDLRGVTSYEYDLRDRLTKQKNPDGSFISYTYDASGNRASMTTPSGTTKYEYDALNRLVKVTDPDGEVIGYSYDKVGNRNSIAYPNGTTATYEYDPLNRLLKLVNKDKSGKIISSYDYTLAPAGNRTKVVENTGRTVDYDYDVTGKLISENITDASGSRKISYTYDSVGNRLTKADNGIETKYIYDHNDRLITEGSTKYAYDNNGNMTDKSGEGISVKYVYDLQNRLISVTTTSASGISLVQYSYDCNGLRIGKTVDGKNSSKYLIDENRQNGEVTEETDGSGNLIVRYTLGVDRISQKRGSISSYYMYDGNGSVRMLTDNTDSVTDTYTYDAFGNLIASTAKTVNEYMYSGEQFDPNVGFYNLRARWYNPEMGRFMSEDPELGSIHDPRTLHRYTYCANNPIMYKDPSGRFFGLFEVEFAAMTLQQVQLNYSKACIHIAINVAYDAYTLLNPALATEQVCLNAMMNGFYSELVWDMYAEARDQEAKAYQQMNKDIAKELNKYYMDMYLNIIPEKIKVWSVFEIKAKDLVKDMLLGIDALKDPQFYIVASGLGKAAGYMKTFLTQAQEDPSNAGRIRAASNALVDILFDLIK